MPRSSLLATGPGARPRRADGSSTSSTRSSGFDFLALNTHRPLFRDARLRQAVNYAIDRRALARLGDAFSYPLRPTDHYLPPGVPGFRDVSIYPFTPDLAKARRLAGGKRRTAVLYTCNLSPCDQQAQIVKTDLATIGIEVQVKTFPLDALFTRVGTKGEPFDLAWGGWVADYPDPDNFLNLLLEGGHPDLRRPGLQAQARRRGAALRPGALPRLRQARRRPRPQRRPVGRLRQHAELRLLLRPNRLPDLPARLRHRPRRALHPTPLARSQQGLCPLSRRPQSQYSRHISPGDGRIRRLRWGQSESCAASCQSAHGTPRGPTGSRSHAGAGYTRCLPTPRP